MESNTGKTKRNRKVKRTLLWILTGFLVIIIIAAVLLYNNFNRLLTAALIKSFNSSSVSDVYELKFEKLSVNLIDCNIKVYDVQLQPREKPLHSYPYINSSFILNTHKILLNNVEILTLLKSNILKLERIEITEPDVKLEIGDKIPILFPFKDTTGAAVTETPGNKKTIESFLLKEFDLVDASFRVTNTARQREFSIQKFNISLRDLLISQQPGKDIISYKHVDLSIGESSGKLQKEPIKYVSFQGFKIGIDSLEIQKSIDTLIFHFSDFSTGMTGLDIQTADSIFHLKMQSFQLSYKDKSIKLNGVSFTPNISEAAMQARFKYQNTQFSGSVGSLTLAGVNFDTLIYKRKIFIDQIVLDSISASIFKDKTKPMDLSRFPEYLGQSVKKIPVPIVIPQVKATNVNLVNREKNPDGSYGIAHINRGIAEVKNVTNLGDDDPLSIRLDAYVENKVPFSATLDFSYTKPEFKFAGKLNKFNLPDLNPLIEAYTPATIRQGTVDEISFSGTAYHTNASGTMKFLYHDLAIDMELREKATWRNSLIAFAANSLVASANPAPDQPARVVQFRMDRDMNKAFVNVVIKSILDGLKETIVMSKENRKAQNEKKKKMKEKNKKEG